MQHITIIDLFAQYQEQYEYLSSMNYNLEVQRPKLTPNDRLNFRIQLILTQLRALTLYSTLIKKSAAKGSSMRVKIGLSLSCSTKTLRLNHLTN